MSENEILLTDVVTVEQLLVRWPGLLEIELSKMIADRQPQPFWLKKIQTDESGNKIYVCDKAGDGSFQYVRVVFREEDVKHLEEQNPRFKWPVVEKCDRPRRLNDWSAESEWVSCDILPDRFCWSPFDVLDLLVSGELRYRSSTNSGISNIDQLCLAEVYCPDLSDWEAKNVGRISNVLVQDRVKARLQSESDSSADNAVRIDDSQHQGLGMVGLEDNAEVKPVVVVPTSLFADKTPQGARAALRNAETGEHIIAYVLTEFMGQNATTVGRLLMHEMRNGLAPSDSTALRHAKKLLRSASALKIIQE
jgi:hypothetical protein